MNWLRIRQNKPAEPTERGKFLTTRDQMLYIMTEHGWCNERTGSVNSPTGLFARLSNEPDDSTSLADAFGEEFDALGMTPADIAGHFLLVESELGFVDVTEYPSAVELLRDYHTLKDQFKYWMIETDGGRHMNA